jgi:hypothetical protein
LLAYPVEPTAVGVLPHDGVSADEATDAVGTHRPDRTLVIAACDPLAGLLVQKRPTGTALRACRFCARAATR